MSTGTCRGLIVAALGLCLAGCDDPSAFNFAANFGAPAPLRSAELGRGDITLVAPPGFCIDRRSLSHSFALMARCDTMGGTASAAVPLAVITATTVNTESATRIGAQGLGASAETVLQQQDLGDLTLVQVEGTPPSPDMRTVYWRGAAQVDSHVIGLALYEAESGPRDSGAAPELLLQTLRATQARTATSVATRQDNSATSPAKPAQRGFLSGLFE